MIEGRENLLADVEKKYNLKLESKSDDNNYQGTIANVSTPNTVTYSQKDDKGRSKSGTGTARDKSVTAFENKAGGRFMNKGGLASRKKKK